MERNQRIASLIVVLLHNLYPMSKSSKDFSPTQGGDLVTVVEAQRRGSDKLDFHREVSLCAGSEAGPNIAPVRRIEVSVGVADEPRRGRPAAAAQDLMGAEPRLRVFLIRIRDKSWIGHEVVSGPLPDIADHLTTTKGAVAGLVGANFNDAVLPVEICLVACGQGISPGEMTPFVAQAVTVRSRFCRCGSFPFCFAWQTPSRPGAKRFRFVPTDMHNRQIILQGKVAIKKPLLPVTIRVTAPVQWMLHFLVRSLSLTRVLDRLVAKICERILELRRAAGFQPAPTFCAPPPWLAITAVLDEFAKI